MKVALITNMPAPYRVPAWNLVADQLKDNFLVLFCSLREPNRQWNVPEIRFNHVFLKENFLTKKDGNTFVHNNPDVWKHLKSFRPDVVITGGFNPTMLYGFLYAVLHRKKHIPLTDAWYLSEKHLSTAHHTLRKLVYASSHAYLACSKKGFDYYLGYHRKPQSIFISHYTIDNEAFTNNIPYRDRPYDLFFSGQFIQRKNPDFFIRVAEIVRQRYPGLKILLIGEGPLKNEMLARLKDMNMDYEFPGFARQESLPHFYSSSKIFLFPTDYDAWGVVANESMASGTPVIVSPFAGCGDELVKNGINGYILPVSEEAWAQKCLALIGDQQDWERLSAHARESVLPFSHQNAAKALLEAAAYACNHK